MSVEGISDNTFYEKQTELAIKAVEVLQQALTTDEGLGTDDRYKVDLALKLLAVLHKAPAPGTVSD